MKLNKIMLVLLTVTGASLHVSSSAAQATEICVTGNACFELTDVEKDPHTHKVLRFNQIDAGNYCRNLGLRLPTARELALFAQNLGAQGISETKKDGYDIVRGSDKDGYPDNFYYSSKGYKQPQGDTGRYLFWSSSVLRYFPGQAMVLFGHNGDFDYYERTLNHHLALRCVR